MKKSKMQLKENFIMELDSKLQTPDDAKYILEKYHFVGLYMQNLENMIHNINFKFNKFEFIDRLKSEA